MYTRTLITAIAAFFVGTGLIGQDFINGDLEGPSPTSLTILPPGWDNVPSTDPVCLATDGSLGDTPDLTDTLGPSAFTGIVGNPYSGSTFMSGCRSSPSGGSWAFQEGIMQTVSGFVPGNTYTIRFFQAVVKSYGSIDSSGSWIVYAGNTPIGTSAPTYSSVPYGQWPFVWEERMLPFTATSTSHTIKFLPEDDDENLDVLDPNGALRMGIDLVSILPGTHLTGMNNQVLENEVVMMPNPFRDRLTIRFPQRYTMGMVQVCSVTGQVVMAKAFSNVDQNIGLDLSAIPSGAYMVRVALDGQEVRRAVIKE